MNVFLPWGFAGIQAPCVTRASLTSCEECACVYWTAPAVGCNVRGVCKQWLSTMIQAAYTFEVDFPRCEGCCKGTES